MNNNMTKIGRIKYLDIAKCITMYLVIHNHWSLDFSNNVIKIFIGSFHMPLFFIVSGLTLNSIETINDFWNHVKKRVIKILLPFYLWSVLYVGLDLKRLLFIIYGSNPSISRGGGIGGSWFLPCFFLADIVAAFVVYFAKNKTNRLLLGSFILFVLSWLFNNFKPALGFPFNADVALCGAAFILIGLLCKRTGFENWFTKKEIVFKAITLVVSFAIALVIAFINKPSYTNSYDRPVMALGYYGIFPLFIITGLLGTLCVLILSNIIENTRIASLLQKVGMNTFVILMIQQIVIMVCEKILTHFNLVNLGMIEPIILSAFVLLLCHFIGGIIVYVYPNLIGKGVLNKQ